MRKKLGCCILLLVIMLMSACSGVNNDEINNDVSILYNFKEPTTFPFEVNEVSSEIDIQNRDYLHQFIFHYYNEETTQQIRYIVSKVLDEPEDNKVSESLGTEYKLENGLPAYYEEDSTSQSLWWENEDGFLARYVYYVDGNQSELGGYKLEVYELLDLANQVQ
jgi:hypothetical protein